MSALSGVGPGESADQKEPPYGNGDAQAWAAYWMHVKAEHPTIGDDEGTMIGWFANAMQAAIDALPPERRQVHADPDQDFLVLPRDALFEFLGEMALPPWVDADGSIIGSQIDCAPIAERLMAWVREHDLSDLYLSLFGRQAQS